MSTPRVIVIGAGITGLTAAVTLLEEARRRGSALDLVVVERDRTPGGHARTTESNGFVVEAGPNGFLNREPETLDLIEELGLGGRLIAANPAMARRYIVRDGGLRRVPDSPFTLLTSPALTWRGKARLLAEPWAAGPPASEETVYGFAERRIGREAAEMLVDTAVAGISAGDSRRLSVSAQFPFMVEMERDHGSLLRALLARKRSPNGPSRLLSFDRGIGVLPQAMAARLDGALLTGAGVVGIERAEHGWSVRLDDGRALDGERLVLATPARASAQMLSGADSELAALLGQIEYTGIGVVALGFRTTDLPGPLDGYGYLVTKPEGLTTLGVSWESSLFAGRAPAGHVLMRVMLGGSRVPGLADRSDDECSRVARQELARVMGITAEPVHLSVSRWPAAIAQYTLGHGARVEALRERVERHPGLRVCGTSYDGVSLNHAVKCARAVARGLAAEMWGGHAGAAPSARELVTE